MIDPLAHAMMKAEFAITDRLPREWRSLVHEYGDVQGVLILRGHGYTAQAARHVFEDAVRQVQQKETKI